MIENLIEKIEKWAEDRNLISGSNPIAQAEKTMEECEELMEAVAENDIRATIDAVGDIAVTLIIQCRMQGINFVECIDSAYDVIKDRKGKMINGKFVKDGDDRSGS